MNAEISKNPSRKVFLVLGFALSGVCTVLMLSGCRSAESVSAPENTPNAVSEAESLQSQYEFESLPDDVQLIPRLEIELPYGIEEMVVWPSSEYIDEHYATDDISDQLPPVYPERAMEDAKPIVPGGVSPEAAVEEAEWWFREILKEEWIPHDLRERLIPIRAEAAQWSMVIGRYQTQGHTIQVSQTRWGIVVVISPAFEGNVDEAEEFSRMIFDQFFTRGEEMITLDGQSISDAGEQFQAYLLDETRLPGPDAIENWWGWIAWYSDGRSIAIFMNKRIAGQQHTPTPDDPWF